MITCKWCGVSYQAFQPTCDKCGGSLPLPAESPPARPVALPAEPPPPPRRVSGQAAWRILFVDGWAIAALVLVLLGAIFGTVGAALTLSIVAAFVGLPFAGLGVVLLGAGVPILVWRYQAARRTVAILAQGEAQLGEIVDVSQDYRVRVNGRHPWTVTYEYEVQGNLYSGKVTTLSPPDLSQQPGQPVYVLYLEDDPGQNTIYPSPYGYDGQ
jgi:hypothetical protein